MTERWLPVPGYEGLYSVSDQGRVRSEPRLIAIRPEYSPAARRGRILKPNLVGSKNRKYLIVNLQRNKHIWRVGVHRLVALAFIGPVPAAPNHRVLHWDDAASNNHWTNLRYGSSTDNQLDCVRNGNNPNASKTHCVNGHEFTPENTWRMPSRPTYRICRTCKRARRINTRKAA
jgi:hypothetical protein